MTLNVVDFLSVRSGTERIGTVEIEKEVGDKSIKYSMVLDYKRDKGGKRRQGEIKSVTIGEST